MMNMGFDNDDDFFNNGFGMGFPNMGFGGMGFGGMGGGMQGM